MSRTLMETAAVLGLLAGIATSLSVLTRFSRVGAPMRWLWRRLVTEPVASWFTGVVSHTVTEAVSQEFRKLAEPNGGKSLADLAEALRRIEQRQTGHTGEHPVTE